MIGFLDTNYQYAPIGYGNPEQESTFPLQGYMLAALAATTIAVVSAIVVIRLKRSHLSKPGGIPAVLASLIVLAITMIARVI